MCEMRVKKRLLGAIRGQEIDRMPWSPFLAYYWDFVDEAIAKKGQFAYLQDLKADPLLRGFHCLYQVKRHQCEIHDVTHGKTRTVTYTTPVGTLREVYTFAPAAKTWFLTGHPVTNRETLNILQYIYEHTEIVRNTQQFDEDWQTLGDDALLLPVIGTLCKTGIQSMVEHWLGTEELAYAMLDYPEEVESCLAVMRLRDRETVEISADSDAEGFIFWEDSSTTNLTPDTFCRYAAPQINEWGDIIHAHGKLLIHHACGHLKDLLAHMGETRIDAIESISPPPTGNVEISDAFSVLPAHIGLIGGIEPTVLLNETPDRFEQYVKKLILDNRSRRFVLANSDSCPPFVDEAKFAMVSQMVRDSRRYVR